MILLTAAGYDVEGWLSSRGTGWLTLTDKDGRDVNIELEDIEAVLELLQNARDVALERGRMMGVFDEKA
jgi:hypothetical protein